jgi:hypothetical protein
MNILYWVVVVIAFLFGGFAGWGPGGNRWVGGVSIAFLLLFIFIGVRDFPIPFH